MLRNWLRNQFDQVKEILMATQADVDALTTAVTGFQSALAQDVANINNEIQVLQQQIAAGGTVDLTALQAAVAAMGNTVAAAGQIAPPAPQPL